MTKDEEALAAVLAERGCLVIWSLLSLKAGDKVPYHLGFWDRDIDSSQPIYVIAETTYADHVEHVAALARHLGKTPHLELPDSRLRYYRISTD